MRHLPGAKNMRDSLRKSDALKYLHNTLGMVLRPDLDLDKIKVGDGSMLLVEAAQPLQNQLA